MLELDNEKSTYEIAERLYELTKDMDWADCEETRKETIAELEEAIYHLKTVAENEYNKDYFRVLYNTLQRI